MLMVQLFKHLSPVDVSVWSIRVFSVYYIYPTSHM